MKRLEVEFCKTGEPWFFNLHTIDFMQGRITKEEWKTRTAAIKPLPFSPFSETVHIMLKAEDYADVITNNGLCLSNGNGPTRDLFFYRLHDSGSVSYFQNNVKGERTEHGEWNRNVPTWCANFSDQARPSVKLILLANRFEQASLLRKLPVDVARMIAKMVWETRKDPVWFFLDEKHKKKRAAKKRRKNE